MVTSIPVVESSLTTPRVRLVSFDQPWEWLAAGWKDLYVTVHTPCITGVGRGANGRPARRSAMA
jgi:hypothetical protein